MSLEDRERERLHRMDGEFERPPHRRSYLWIVMILLVIILVFRFMIWLRP